MFKCANFEIVEYSPDSLGLIVYNSALANRVNNWLNYYPDTHIKPLEEPLFKITRNELPELYALLPEVNKNSYVEKVFEKIKNP